MQKNTSSAQATLQRAHELLAERGKTYDASGQERSMAHIVAAFNAVYWQCEPMTVQQGWDFMLLLKMVRGANVLHEDSAEDMVSYAALRAECVLEQLENQARVNKAE